MLTPLVAYRDTNSLASAWDQRDCMEISAQLFGKRVRNPSALAAQVPRSVIKPVTRRAGVTSKPGLAAELPGAAISTVGIVPFWSLPVILGISEAARSSI